MKKKILVFAFALAFSACSISESQTQTNNKILFFDLKGYLETEIQTNLASIKKVKKSVTINGKTEVKEIAITNWKEELKPFFNVDINRPAWLDKYEIDSYPPNNLGQQQTIYKAKDKYLKTQNMTITNQDKQVMKIEVFNSDNSPVTESETRLVYSTSGYSISTQQKLLGARESIAIQVDFIKN